MYRGRLWTMRQYAGFGTAQETNARFRHLLDAGQTGLSVAFDLPTQMGIDSDSPRAQGEVGRVGVAIDTRGRPARRCFDGIPLDKVSTSMTINATASTLLAMYIVVAEERGIARSKLSGTIQNDILKEYVARGTYVYPPEPSLALIAETFRFCAAEVPNWNPISMSGYHMREAGATAVQELAFTLRERRSRTCSARSRRGSPWTRSRRGSRSSSRATTTCSRRSPSSAPRGACGRASCATASRRTTRAAGCASTRRRAA